MLRWPLFLLGASLCLAQAPSDPPKPPEDVDRALRARVTEFYQDHVDGKFRQAEALVADDTKDFFYSASKPKYLSFEIAGIKYMDNFTRANVTIVLEQYIMMPGFTDKPVKVPAPSMWKLVDGQWYWYVDQATLHQTPFGGAKDGPASTPTPIAIPKAEDMVYIFTLVKADKQAVNLKPGETEKVTITNSAKGAMVISLSGKIEGVQMSLDRQNLQAGEQAVLTIKAESQAKSGGLAVQVSPTGQTIPIQVNVK
jgi:hypothetical protein